MTSDGTSPDATADEGRRPTLSLCVPTYNRPSLVQRAIRSIIESASAAAEDVEIIVSDNSPDVSERACREALESWAGRSLYVGNRPDVGMAGNFNQCLALASGRFVLFVQDDDRLLPGAVPTILQALASGATPDRVVLFGVHLVDEAGRLLRRQEYCRDDTVGPADALHRLLSDNGLAVFPGAVVSRDAYQVVGPFDATFGNAMDLEMWVRLFARYGVRCFPGAIGAYSVHAASATQLMGFDAHAVDRLMAVFASARRTGVLDAETVDRCEANYLHQFVLGAASVHLRQGDQAGARGVIQLFKLPSIRALGPSRAWGPVRFIFSVLVRCPPAVVRPLMRWVDRLDLVRRVRSAQDRGHAGLPVC